MEVKIIQKYSGKSISALKSLAEKHFNKFIRYRDTDDNGFGRCISSGQPLKVPSRNAHAGHFYSSGKYPELKLMKTMFICKGNQTIISMVVMKMNTEEIL